MLNFLDNSRSPRPLSIDIVLQFLAPTDNHHGKYKYNYGINQEQTSTPSTLVQIVQTIRLFTIFNSGRPDSSHY